MERYSDVKKSNLAGMLGNIFLLIIKLIIGLLSRSQALIADAVNSAGDIFSSIMSTIGTKIASFPEDDDHNFGHGKAEYIFSLFIGISMIVVATKLLYDSGKSIFEQKEVAYANLVIIICIITITLKICLFFLY